MNEHTGSRGCGGCRCGGVEVVSPPSAGGWGWMPMVCDDEGIRNDQNTNFFREKFSEGPACGVAEGRK